MGWPLVRRSFNWSVADCFAPVRQLRQSLYRTGTTGAADQQARPRHTVMAHRNKIAECFACRESVLPIDAEPMRECRNVRSV
jgi:hypothetical protein